MEITKSEFLRYENLRKSGITNMYDIQTVMSFTWLSREKVLFIMKNYKKLFKKLYETEDERMSRNNSKGFYIN